jgi:ribosome-associated protein
VRSPAAKPSRPKRPAEKPSRTAMRSERISAGAPSKRPRPQPESRNESQLASQALALLVAKAALDKKAVNVQIVDVVGRVDYADYLVVMSGRSDRHVLAVADGIEDELVRLTPKRKPIAVEGRPQGTWVVLDYGEVVAHVFQEDARSFYDLDNLWQDARKVPVAHEGPPRSTVS